MTERTIETRAGLSDEQRDAVLRLRAAVEEHDRSDLKVELSIAAPGDAQDTVLLYERGALIGFCGLDDGVFLEVCGMVHPGHRRSGAGGALLDSALQLARERGRTDVLVVCEDAVPFAASWLERRGARLQLAEHRMVLALDNDPSPGDVLPLRTVQPDDIDALIDVIARGFDEARPVVEARLREHPDSDVDTTFVAEVAGTLVATVRVSKDPVRPMIYGFVVADGHRGRGHGAAVLRAVLQRLRAAGTPQAGLEVETTNDVAIRLYERFGFRRVTTYRYLRLPL